MATMLGRLLVDRGAASPEQVETALAEQRETRERLGAILIRNGLDAETVARALAAQLRLGYAPPPLEADPDALELIPGALALRHRVLPLRLDGRSIRVAMVDPLDAAAIDDLQFRTGRRADPAVATEAALEQGLMRAYGQDAVRTILRRLAGLTGGVGARADTAGSGRRGAAGIFGGGVGRDVGGGRGDGGGGGGGGGGGAGNGGDGDGDGGEAGGGGGGGGGGNEVARVRRRGAVAGRSGTSHGGEAELLRQASEAPPIIALVNLLLDRAVGAGASDVHIEPERERVQVRARVDGTLRRILELPVSSASAVTSRIKIMAGLDIAVKRRPQDGRSAITVGGQRIGIRVSTLPAQDGEKVVLRLLDPRNALRTLDELGLDPWLRRDLSELLTREHGLFLVTGPTGSGKTTTLYALLQSRDRIGRNIVTLEDPVEYRLDGLTQVQVHARAGLTFAAALRSVLRQDPDVVLVGEMRDTETAEVGLAAALTGHLVFSTLHTIDAPGAVTRLVEMGAPRYLVAGGLAGVLAQRLVRRLCPDCRTVAPASGAALHELGLPIPAHLPRAVGCDRCGGSGYRGRVGVFELLRVDGVVRELILDGASADAVREAAGAAGMTSLALDAWDKVERGLTTIEEVRPLLSLLDDTRRACRSCGARLQPGHVCCPLCGGEVARRCACGTHTRPHWRFCGACGERLESRAAHRPRTSAPGLVPETDRAVASS